MEMGKEVSKFFEGVPFSIIEFSQYMQPNYPQVEGMAIHQILESYAGKNSDSILQNSLPSYDNLPDHLKPCFLYLGNLAKQCQIDADKLYLFWLVEELIMPSAEKSSLKIAVDYLNALAGRGMLEVHEAEIPSFFEIKSCQINRTMQNLSLSMSKEQGFFEVVGFGDETKEGHDYQPYRLAIDLDNYEDGQGFPVSRREMRHIRCLLLCSRQASKTFAWPKDLSTLVYFNYLRILDFDGFDFGVINLPKDIGMLLHLRCLSFRNCVLPELPSSVGNLRLLLALDLRVRPKSKTIIPNILQKLKKLMHLFLPESFCTKDGRRLRLKGLTKLESIINFNSGVLNVKDLFQLPNLQYVSSTIDGNNIEDVKHFVEGITKKISDQKNGLLCKFQLEIRNFDCCTEDRHTLLRCILKWNSLISFTTEGRIRRLPCESEFSCNLSKIELIGLELYDDPMGILEKLKKLIVLVLDDEAFGGKKMTCSASGFPELKCLELLNLPKLEEWIVEDGAMPKLSKLIIKSCGKLSMVPEKLGFDSSHQEAKISGMPKKSMAIVENESGTIKFVLPPPPMIIKAPKEDGEDTGHDENPIGGAVEKNEPLNGIVKERKVAQAAKDTEESKLKVEENATRRDIDSSGYLHMTENGLTELQCKPEEERRIVGQLSGETESSLDGVYDDHDRLKPGTGRDRGPAGLENLGNTCYMNSVLQCFVHTPPLVQYFLKEYSLEINRENMGKHGELAFAFDELLRELQSSTKASIAPRTFLQNLDSRVQHFGDDFIVNNQQDSHELLAILLSELHKDLNHVKQIKPGIKEKVLDGQPDEEVADELWRNEKVKNDSIILDTFQGQEKSTQVCSVCQTSSKKFDLFRYLCLALPWRATDDGKALHDLNDSNYLKDPPEIHKSGILAKEAKQQTPSLYSCLDAYSKEEILDSKNMRYCPRCKQLLKASKKLDLWRLPEILVIQLKRFLQNSEGGTYKVDTLVEFPIHNLDLKKYVRSKGVSKGSHVYELFAISNHHGLTFASGHYTAYCKLIDGKIWYHFDDEKVSPVNKSEIITSDAYLLFYQRVKTSTSGAAADVSEFAERG